MLPNTLNEPENTIWLWFRYGGLSIVEQRTLGEQSGGKRVRG